MTLHVSRLVVENFRNFQELELDPFPSSAVIVGENGIGKTNLLFALRLVLDPNLPDSRRQLRAEDICEFVGKTIADRIEIRVTVELSGFDDDPAAQAELDGCIVSVNPFIARLTYLFRPKAQTKPQLDPSPDPVTADDYEWLIFGGDQETSDARRVRRSITFEVLPALRDAVGDLASNRRSPLTELLDNSGPDPAALEKASAEIEKATEALAADTALTQLAENIEAQVVSMAGPQLDLEPTLGFASSRPDQLLHSIRLFVDAARSRTVADTSTGNANVVYLALLLERLGVRRRADQVVATLLGVEEPEAHLHPGLQRHLFGYLLRSASGLLLTTHSPHIAAVAPLASIVLLGRDPATSATVAHTAQHAALSAMEHDDLERYIDVTRAEILFARIVVFVEGTAEAYLLPALASAAGFDLDAYGVVVASVSGTDFVPYRRLCLPDGLSVPHVVVTDGDRDVGAGYLGLARSADLVAPTDQQAISDGVKSLRQQGAGDASADEAEDAAVEQVDEAELIELAVASGVYVGSETLELDLIPLLEDEMNAAYVDLHSGSVDAFTGAVTRVANGHPEDGDLDRILRGINRVGKGRFSQRVAGHIRSWAPGELHARVAQLADAGTEDVRDVIDDDVLAATGGPAYVLRVLDSVSRRMRSAPLLARTVDADTPSTG